MKFELLFTFLSLSIPIILIVHHFYREIRIWYLLTKYGHSITGKCIDKEEKADGDGGYERYIYYEFKIGEKPKKSCVYKGQSWVPRRLFIRMMAGAKVRIRYCLRDPEINRIDEWDFKNWGFRLHIEAGGDTYPDTQKSGYDS